MAITWSTLTSPSNGQPNATETVSEIGGHPRALVADAEAVGGAHHHIGLVDAAGHGPVPAALVQHQADARASGLPRQGGHDLLGPGHLRHAARIDEAHRLDAPGAGGLQAADELDLVRRFQHRLLVLQPVARAHLHDLDQAAHGLGPGAGGVAGRKICNTSCWLLE
jgi:hypothetical protein